MLASSAAGLRSQSPTGVCERTRISVALKYYTILYYNILYYTIL